MPRPAETPKSTLRVALRPAGGIKSDRDSSLIGDGQAAFAENCEFSTETARISKGSRKLGNQTLPQPAVLCRPDPAYSPLYIEASKSVPLRGYVAWPYDSVRDIGGDDASTGVFPTLEYHARRGRSFERQYTVTIPPDFQMHERPARGEGVPAVENAAVAAGPGYDEGLDDCTLIAQKGGDRTTPMSWALGIVNAGNHAYNIGAGSALARKSGYFFTFMWFDAPEWGAIDQTKMRYSLTDPSSSSTGLYSTQALRAFILDGKDDTVAYALEPGKTYSISISVTLDTAAMTAGAWNGDGRVDFRVQEHGGRLYQGSFASGTATNISAWKGPLDSLDYLSKYGIRYSGMDMEHIGLGYRLGPWQAQGWIPYGHDSAAMEHKGFRMADCSLNSIDDLYGSGQYTLVCSHAGAADAYVTINSNRALVTANANFKQSPLGVIGAGWSGYGAGNSGAPASDFNANALRGYRWVVPRSSVTDLQGGCLNIEDYIEAGVGDYRINLKDAASLGITWTDQPFLIRAFRWNQQALVIQEARAWSTVRDYTDPRVVFSMRSSLELSDQTEPNLERLEAYLPMNDAGGAVCRELVRGKDAYLAPFGLGVKDYGDEEERRSLFLSGEGDALVYDLSENPVFKREMKALLQSNSRGFAIEISCIIPEAYYGVAITDPTGPRALEYEAAYCPDLVAWSVKGADEAGVPDSPAPLLVMGHHSWWALGTGTTPERKPQGFQVDYHAGLDGDNAAMSSAIVGITRSTGGAGLWDDTAPWVGKRITIQVGVQPSPDNRAGTSPSEFRVYIAASPKGSLKFDAGENPASEFAYFSDKTIQKKELERLIVTIGGAWNPSAMRGYTEYSARMIVEDVRVYGAVASGELPAASGDVTPARRGKIHGRNSLPQRDLTLEDIVRPVGPGTRTAKLSEGSTLVETSGAPSFFTQLPEDSLESVQERFLVPLADLFPVPSLDQIVDFTQEFYWIKSLAADGSSMTLASPYEGPESLQASVGAVNLIGYTTFKPTLGDVLRAPLSLGSGLAFKPGTTTTEDLALSPELFEGLGPIQGEWKVRIAAPFTEGGLATVLPKWVRGNVTPRRGPVTAVQSLDSSLFAAGRGALFRMDDRWREDGPTDALRSSIQIRGRTVGEHESRFPLANDGILFSRYENTWPYWTSALSRDYTWVYDFDVYLDEYAELQTLSWLGCEFSHLLLGPGANDNRRGVGLWFRLADGRPELVMESQGTYTGGATAPADGKYIATSADRIPLKRWTRVRFYLENYLDGVLEAIRVPGIHIEGHPTSVSVNAVEAALVDPLAWMQTGNGGGLIGSIGDSRNTLLVGVARDAVRTHAKAQFTAINQLGGMEFPGTRIAGHMHPLLGRIGRTVVWRALTSDSSVANYPAYNPETFDYAGRLVRFQADMEEGVGETVADTGTETEVGFDPLPGLILSHPALDLYNEFGSRTASPSLVPSGNRVYAANGGRVVSLLEDSGGPAGVLAPNSRPEVVVSRKPLWEPNFAPAGSSSAEQDPIEEAAAGAAEQIHHYSSYGNNYLRQSWDDALRWSKDDAAANTPFDIFGLKFYWHPRSTSGVIPLWGARGSRDSGGIYLECVDGRAVVGWYDTEKKKRVFVETSAQVFRPGYWYYVYLRKAFPMEDEQEGNWYNSYYSEGDRRRAAWTGLGGTWAVGDLILDTTIGNKRGLVTKVTTTHVEDFKFSADADIGLEAVDNGAGATATISAAPFHNTGDSLVVREFHKTGTFIDTVLWKQLASGALRNFLGFTSEMPRTAGTTAVGQITPKGMVFTGGPAGAVVVGALDGVALGLHAFHRDMEGMQFQFTEAVAGTPEKVYRISSVTTAVTMAVVDEDGNSPNLTGKTNEEGAVFSGVELKKSEDYDASHLPDQASYGVEFMGSGLAHISSNGIAKHNGKFASFGWVVASSDISTTAFYSGFNLFETATPTDLHEIGTDTLSFSIFSSSGRPGELRFDSGAVFSVVDGQPYAGATAKSSQPSSALEVTQDTEANEDAESLFWRYVQDPKGWEGLRQVFVTFYDRGQAQESNPSEALVVEVPSEDESNPSGLSRLDLTNVPISHQPGPIERWIYATRADEIVPFRVAVIPDNRASSISLVLDDQRFNAARLLSHRNGTPPDCFALATSQDRMWFGDLRIPAGRQRDAIAFSSAFFPTRVPFGALLPLITGRSERVVGMADVDGILMVWKRDAMIQVLLREGRPIAQVKSENVGLAGPQAVVVLDRDAYWLSEDRGMYLFPGAGGPIWLGENLSDVFGGVSSALNVDGRHLGLAAVAVNRNQDQVVALFRAREDLDQRRRLSIEFDGALAGSGVPGNAANGFRYALYAGPNLTAIGAVNRRVAGPQRFVGGTVEGFVAYLDRSDTQRELAAPTGTQTLTLGAGSTTSKLVLGTADTSLVGQEGVRGLPLAWLDSASEPVHATALFSDGSSIWLDRPVAAAPGSGTTVSLGAIHFEWRSKRLDLGAPEDRKIPHFAHIVLVPQASGTAWLEVYEDYGGSPVELVVDGDTGSRYALDLTKPVVDIPLGEIRSQFVQLRIRVLPPSVGVTIELKEVVLHWHVAELH